MMRYAFYHAPLPSRTHQPISDSSISSSLVGERSDRVRRFLRAFFTVVSDTAAGATHGKDGRIMHGKPASAATASASSIVCAIPERAVSGAIFFIAISKRRRSSALSMASAVGANHEPTPNSSSTPCRSSSSAQFSAVWPPMVGSTASDALFNDFAHHFPVNRLDGQVASAISGRS